ncbi:FYVE, RhoGEF and PH domain-containing protein 6-like [Limulus polyphemus]|uniref:FYVE, RhoGEF and PH domain-containing protein 6-like n=1 Tax=Limulus polyphemus TaxID=6850 RepID=A0ABM1C1U0_LIMPO|nr:FYVE, RhoGEF and PH domain-containing protein 6-like [Limulus polyphemus]
MTPRPHCQKLSLNNYMLKPIQRISQYCLLLQDYLNHLQEDSPDYEDTVAALQIMSQVASETMKHEDNISKLISIQNSLCGHHEVIRPGRVFIKDGDLMKLSRKIMKPRRFILFNDSLWYTKQVQYKLYRVKHEFPLTGMKVSIPIQQDYENEFNIISMTKSFILSARNTMFQC